MNDWTKKLENLKKNNEISKKKKNTRKLSKLISSQKSVVILSYVNLASFRPIK